MKYNSNHPDSPAKVPPFDGKVKEPVKRYYWWSWHPLYPYWSKSCWGGSTIAEAVDVYSEPIARGMYYYHNKLIREDDGGKLVEIFDRPCEEMGEWERCAKQIREAKGAK
jgi:hypothetical protein